MTETINRSYHNVVQAALAKPWAILESHIGVLGYVLALRMSGQRLTEEELTDRLAAKPKKTAVSHDAQSVAVIPVWGSIIPRGASFDDVSMGQATSMEQLINEVAQAAADTSVTSILLDIDSPGGQVDMVPEAAAAIRRARQRKPVIAVANTMAASAAYWLASQATELVVTPSGEVGSIGVFAVHTNVAEQLRMLGISPTIIKAGKHKAELSSLGPLSEDAERYQQAQVDEYYRMFTRDVGAGRRVSADVARGPKFGEGRMVLAQQAVRDGMADRMDTFDNTLGRMLEGQISVGTSALAELPEEAPDEQEGFAPLAVEVVDEDEADETVVQKPHEQLAALRQESRKAATSEREAYLSLLRRIK